MADHVQVAGEAVPFEQALSVVVGYCLGEEQVAWRPPRTSVGDSLKPLTVGAFAYRTYDCVFPSASPGLEAIDLFVVDGLNGRMMARDFAVARAVCGEVSGCLSMISGKTRFWELERDEVSVAPKSERDRAWPIWRAWAVLIGAPGIDLARTHKILHHKRPDVFPLLDNQTVKHLPKDSWGAIHDDLLATAAEWEQLEDRINPRLLAAGGVELTRLRLHDILLWCRATENTRTAARLGRKWLKAHGG